MRRSRAWHIDEYGTAPPQVGVALVERLPVGRRPEVSRIAGKGRPCLQTNNCFAATPWVSRIREGVPRNHEHVSAIAGNTAVSPDATPSCCRGPSHDVPIAN